MRTNIKPDRRMAVSVAGAIIIMVGLVVIGGILVGGIIKISRKIPGNGSGGGTNSEPKMVESVVDMSSGLIVPIPSLNLTTNTPLRIMVQRWFPDAPEEFLYITTIDTFREVGIVDPTPHPVAGFYHVYLVTP